MASIVTGGGVTNIIGSHAGNTFARNKGGLYMKKKTHGTNPSSPKQSLHRTHIGQVSKHYSNTLSQAQRVAWATYAATTPVINRLGNTAFLSAQQMFSKLSAQLLSAGTTFPNTPPVSGAIGTLSSISISFDHAGNLVLTDVTAAPGGDDYIVYFVSPPMNPGRQYVSSQLRRLTGFWTPNSANNVTAAYLAVYGLKPTAAGQSVAVRGFVLNTVNGLTSAQLQANAFWI